MALVTAALPANISGAEDAAVGTDTLPPLERRLCVLPLGDSITQGDDDHATWRHPLWQSLLDARPASTEVLFTGQMVNHYGEDIGMIHPQAAHARAYDTGTVEFPFPPHHEGHWGWTTDQVRFTHTLKTVFRRVSFTIVHKCLRMPVADSAGLRGRSVWQWEAGCVGRAIL